MRQKLARFNTQEFSNILLEILNESQRRYNQIEAPSKEAGQVLPIDDEDPLYDKVPSDEDYASVASESSSTIQIGGIDTYDSSPPPPKPSKQFNYNSNGTKKQSQSNQNQSSNSIYHQHSPSPHSSSNSPLGGVSKSLSAVVSHNNKSSTPPKHKILNTRFEKAPIAAAASAALAVSATSSLPSGVFGYPSNGSVSSPGNNNSALVANAESCLNSIINSLNQIDYSTGLTTSPVGGGQNHRNYCGMTTDSFELAQSAVNNGFKFPTAAGTTRPDLFNELKSENELMQAMVIH